MGVAAGPAWAAGGQKAHGHPQAAWYLNWMATLTLSILVITGRIRDLLWRRHPQPRKGYADVSEPQAAFYARRIYGRIHDCCNRPIASAPGAWVDVMERDSIAGRMRDTRALPPTGATRRCLNLGSYNYLGFAASDPYCTPRVLRALSAWGVSACAPRAAGGETPLHRRLETAVAEFVGTEDAICFGMGFATNSSTLPVLCGPATLVLSDSLNHNSIVAGLRAGGATVKVFRHNDPRHLESLLRFNISEGQPRTRRPWKKIIIVVEGIYSMEGEAPPLAAIVALKKRYGAYLYLDEAHSIGAMGHTGRGLCEAAGVNPRDVDVLMGTFTKSFGSAGGYVAGSRALVAYLRCHSPAHLYAAAMAPGVAEQIIAALDLIRDVDGSGRGPAKVRQLHDNANYFRCRLLDMGLHVLGDWDSPVIPVMVYHVGMLGAISRALLGRRVAAVVVGFPVTPLLLCRLRVCISAAHTRDDLEYALDAMSDVLRAAGLDYDRPGAWQRMGAAWGRMGVAWGRAWRGAPHGAAMRLKGAATWEQESSSGGGESCSCCDRPSGGHSSGRASTSSSSSSSSSGGGGGGSPGHGGGSSGSSSEPPNSCCGSPAVIRLSACSAGAVATP